MGSTPSPPTKAEFSFWLAADTVHTLKRDPDCAKFDEYFTSKSEVFPLLPRAEVDQFWLYILEALQHSSVHECSDRARSRMWFQWDGAPEKQYSFKSHHNSSMEYVLKNVYRLVTGKVDDILPGPFIELLKH